MNCTPVCAAQTTYLFFTKLKIKPDFPCLADEISEPRPDMNIKVTAFTVSEKSINTLVCYVFFSAVQCPKTIANGQLSDSCSLDFGETCTSANCSYGYESSASFSITCTAAGTWDDDTTVLCTGLYIHVYINNILV